MNKFIIMFISVMLFSGCSKESPKIDIPKDMEVTKLSTILENPSEYYDKKVLLEGIIAYCCPSGCEFTLQDGKDTIVIHPTGFTLPKIKKGQRVKVYAEITSGKEKVIVSAIKLETLK